MDSHGEVDVEIPEPLVVYMTTENLPIDYKIFKRIIVDGDNMLDYETMEAKLIATKMLMGMGNVEQNTEAFGNAKKSKLPKSRTQVSTLERSTILALPTQHATLPQHTTKWPTIMTYTDSTKVFLKQTTSHLANHY